MPTCTHRKQWNLARRTSHFGSCLVQSAPDLCHVPLKLMIARLKAMITSQSYFTCWPPLWSSGQSSWLQIQRSGLHFRLYQILWEVVGLERGPLSLVSTIEELLERNNSGSGLENRERGRRNPLCWPHDILYLHKLALTSLTSGGRSVGIVR
jgi:hypothetical protein